MSRYTKIPTDERSAILAMYASGTKPAEIAKNTGRSLSVIYKICHGEDLNMVQKIAEDNLKNIAAVVEELEDVENGIPNTPLVSADAEQKSENAEYQSLPFCVQIAVDRYIKDLKLEIEEREQRIVELQQELDDARMKLHDSIEFRRKYRAKVDAVEDPT